MPQRFRSIDEWKIAAGDAWEDWHWQLRNLVQDGPEISRLLTVPSAGNVGLSKESESRILGLFPLRVTPALILALSQALKTGVPGASHAFRRCFMLDVAELSRTEGPDNGQDCIGEELPQASPASSITKFYRNRVLFRVTSMCPTHCRFCFRRRIVGSAESWNSAAIEEGLACISEDKSIREVILSGGDPLVLSDSRIEMLLERICSNDHVRRIRFDTKVLSALPQRITSELIQLLQRFAPVYVVGHFTHSYEVSERTRTACEALANAGIPLAAHTPLLKGVNDDADTLANLFELLVDCRVRPYYLIQFIPTRWSEHFRVRISDSLEIVKALGGRCSGLATPTYIVYLPDAGGKVPALPPYLQGRNETGWVFENLEGRRIVYPEPTDPEAERGS